jgi:hypothetical protein
VESTLLLVVLTEPVDKKATKQLQKSKEVNILLAG